MDCPLHHCRKYQSNVYSHLRRVHRCSPDDMKKCLSRAKALKYEPEELDKYEGLYGMVNESKHQYLLRFLLFNCQLSPASASKAEFPCTSVDASTAIKYKEGTVRGKLNDKDLQKSLDVNSHPTLISFNIYLQKHTSSLPKTIHGHVANMGRILAAICKDTDFRVEQVLCNEPAYKYIEQRCQVGQKHGTNIKYYDSYRLFLEMIQENQLIQDWRDKCKLQECINSVRRIRNASSGKARKTERKDRLHQRVCAEDVDPESLVKIFSDSSLLCDVRHALDEEELSFRGHQTLVRYLCAWITIVLVQRPSVVEGFTLVDWEKRYTHEDKMHSVLVREHKCGSVSAAPILFFGLSKSIVDKYVQWRQASPLLTSNFFTRMSGQPIVKAGDEVKALYTSYGYFPYTNNDARKCMEMQHQLQDNSVRKKIFRRLCHSESTVSRYYLKTDHRFNMGTAKDYFSAFGNNLTDVEVLNSMQLPIQIQLPHEEVADIELADHHQEEVLPEAAEILHNYQPPEAQLAPIIESVIDCDLPSSAREETETGSLKLNGKRKRTIDSEMDCTVEDSESEIEEVSECNKKWAEAVLLAIPSIHEVKKSTEFDDLFKSKTFCEMEKPPNPAELKAFYPDRGIDKKAYQRCREQFYYRLAYHQARMFLRRNRCSSVQEAKTIAVKLGTLISDKMESNLKFMIPKALRRFNNDEVKHIK